MGDTARPVYGISSIFGALQVSGLVESSKSEESGCDAAFRIVRTLTNGTMLFGIGVLRGIGTVLAPFYRLLAGVEENLAAESGMHDSQETDEV